MCCKKHNIYITYMGILYIIIYTSSYFYISLTITSQHTPLEDMHSNYTKILGMFLVSELTNIRINQSDYAKLVKLQTYKQTLKLQSL